MKICITHFKNLQGGRSNPNACSHNKDPNTLRQISIVAILIIVSVISATLIVSSVVLQTKNYGLLVQHTAATSAITPISASPGATNPIRTQTSANTIIPTSTVTTSTNLPKRTTPISTTSNIATTSNSTKSKTPNPYRCSSIKHSGKQPAVAVLQQSIQGQKDYTCYRYPNCSQNIRKSNLTVYLKLKSLHPEDYMNFTAYFIHQGVKVDVRNAKHKVAFNALKQLCPQNVQYAKEPLDQTTEAPDCVLHSKPEQTKCK